MGSAEPVAGQGASLRFVAAVGLLALWGCQSPHISSDHTADPIIEVSRANGEQVFWAGGCASCHASAGKLTARSPALGGGRVIETRYGVFRAPNISPDRMAGIGDWSLAEFDRAMRQGIAPDGHAYYPAFPYPSYARMSDQDIADLHDFLGSLPSDATAAGQNRLHFPVNLPMAAQVWQRLNLRPGPAVALESPSPEVARGQYLVEGPGHCGTCHTPRGALGGPRNARWLAGGEMLDGSGFAPNLTPHSDGLGGMSRAEIVETLRPSAPPHDTDAGMIAARANLAHLPESDVQAIAAYLMALPPVASAD